MCAPAIMAVAAAYSAYSQYQQGVSEQKMYNYQADASRQQGAAALAQGQKQGELIQDTAKLQGKEQAIKTAEALSSQRAAMAAMGLDPSSVSAQDLASSSMSKAQMDEAAIRYNADVNSWESNRQGQLTNWQSNVMADQYKYAGKQSKQAGIINAGGTLLSSAASYGMSKWLAGQYRIPKTTTFSPQSPSSGYAFAFRK